jgi:hypothetical protein
MKTGGVVPESRVADGIAEREGRFGGKKEETLDARECLA